MGRKTKIAIVTGVVLVLLGASAPPTPTTARQKDKIAEGVTIGGVDVGGMNADEAEARGPRASCWRRCSTRSRSATTARAGSCPARASRSTPTSTRRSTRRSTRASDGGLPGPPGPLRDRRRASTSRSPPTSPTRSRPSTSSSASVADEVDREPQDAVGRTERRRARSRRRRSTAASCATTCSPTRSTRAVLNADADHTIAARDPPDEAGGRPAAKSPPSTRPT